MQKGDFTTRVLDGLQRVRAKIYDEMEERPFRHDFANIIISEVLGWTRERGKGHYEVSEIRDITCFDDKEFPVLIVETKRPAESLEPKYEKKLGERLKNSGAEYGMLTNGYRLNLYRLDPRGEMTKIGRINIDALAQKDVLTLTEVERQQIAELRKVERIRFLKMDVDYLIERHHKVKVSTDEGFDSLIRSLRFSLNELTVVLTRFFDLFMKSKHAHAQFLKDSFRDWCYISGKGKPDEAKEIFCRETAYVFLNRILFTRICEDKEILSQRLSGHGLAMGYQARERKRLRWLAILKDACEDAREWYEHFYMLSMFDWWEIHEPLRGVLKREERDELGGYEKGLDIAINESLKRFNPFDFSDVDRDILGHIYQAYLPSDERKRLGEFYTPIEVVRYILDATGYTAHSKIEDKYLLDPGCGSGTFLVEAVTRLIDRYRKKGLNLDDPNDARLVLEGIIGHVYGLDINPFACHIAEMNLLFHVIELYEKVRETDRRYRLPRFNIYSTDSLMPPEMGIKLTLEKYATLNARAKAFLDEEKKAVKVKKMEFDFVVGNPPYVRIQLLDPYLLNLYREKYESAFKNFDIYVIFIERGIKWLRGGGKFGYICSNQFMNRVYGEKLRSFILNYCSLHQIIDFGTSGVFADVTNYPCILILERAGLKEPFKCVKVNLSKEGLLDEIEKHIKLNEFREPAYILFTYKQEELTRKSWELTPIDESKVLSLIKKDTAPFGKLSKILLGIQSGKDGLLIVNKVKDIDEKLAEVVPLSYMKKDKRLLIEKDLLKPILMGRNVRRWSIRWDGRYVIYPHRKVADTIITIPDAEIRKKYPHAYEYLSSNRHVLELRRMYRKSPIELHGEFYSLMYIEPSKDYENVKILTPALTDRNNFSLDMQNYFYVLGTAGVCGILPQKMNAHYLLGLLNSRVLEYFLKHITPVKMGGFFQYSTKYLEQVPIRVPRTSKEKQMADLITQKVNQIFQLNKQSDEIEERVSTFPEKYLKGIEKLDKVAWIMDSQELKKDSYKVSKPKIEPLKDLSGQTKYKLTLAKGNHIVFSTREQAEYVLNWLRGKDRVSKNEILDLEIPSEDYLRKIMKEYGGDKKKVDGIKQEIRGLEEEIDELVFDLYGLGKEEKEVINLFLERIKA